MESIQFIIQTDTLIRIFLLGFMGFLVSMLATPLYTTLAYRGEWWKKARTETMGGEAATVYSKLHAAKHKRNIPTMAGIIFVISVALVTLIFNLDRGQTWLPLAAMIGAGAVGLLDDFMNIRSGGGGIAGMQAKIKFALYSAVTILLLPVR